MRDLLDIAALARLLGTRHAAAVLGSIDEYYGAKPGREPVGTRLVRVLAEAKPRDSRTLKDFAHYKGLAAEWSSWADVQAECHKLALAITELSAGNKG